MQNVEQIEMFLYVAGSTLGMIGFGLCLYRLVNAYRYGGHHADETPLIRRTIKENNSSANNYNIIGYV